MIQAPLPGEVLVDVPGLGPVLNFHARIQPLFGGRLASGRVVEVNGERAVDWSLQAGSTSAEAEIADVRRELLEAAQVADETADSLAKLLEKTRDPEARVRVPGELLRKLGGGGASEGVLLARELRALKDVLGRASSGVRRAANRGDFGRLNGRIVVFGWCFLPAEAVSDPAALTDCYVELQLDREVSAGGEELVFTWRVGGAPASVELIRVDGAESAIPETRRLLRGRGSTDVWRFPVTEFPAEARFLARCEGPGGRVDSNIVGVFGGAGSQGAAFGADGLDEELVLEEVEDSDVEQAPVVIDLDPPPATAVTPSPASTTAAPEKKRAGDWRWLWTLLWILLAMVLIWLLYLLLMWLLRPLPPAIDESLDIPEETIVETIPEEVPEDTTPDDSDATVVEEEPEPDPTDDSDVVIIVEDDEGVIPTESEPVVDSEEAPMPPVVVDPVTPTEPPQRPPFPKAKKVKKKPAASGAGAAE